MNERIKELARQSGLIQYDTDSKLVDAEKFAEFIVRDCIDWCNAHSAIEGTAQKIVESIKEHFGIEE